MNEQVLILMAVYNGRKYLSEQIESIINQSYSQWKLVIRDDFSNDGTVKVLHTYCQKDSRIQIIKGDTRLGATRNFGYLIGNFNDSPYIMFADQDDVWMKEKIEITLKAMKRAENMNREKPILVYTDKTVVDARLNPIKSRDYKYEDNLISLMGQSHIYGCTMMINHEMSRHVQLIPKEAMNADYWISMVAAYIGKIYHIQESTIYYRQHGDNVTGGINNYSFKYKVFNWDKNNKDIATGIGQNIYFSEKYKDEGEKSYLLKEYISIFSVNGIRRLLRAIKLKLKRDHFWATLRYYYVLLNYEKYV